MRIVRFLHKDGSLHTGVRQGASIRDMGHRDPLAPFAAAEIAAAPEVPLTHVPKLMCLAGNYAKHIVESGFSDVAKKVWTPQIFWKPSTALLRRGGTVYLRSKNVFFDWEVELAVVIGKAGRDIARENAFDHVFGYTITNDLSERKYNSEIADRDKREFDPFFDWLVNKWFDGSAPLGPELVTKDEIADPEKMGIRLLWNDELMQDSNTSQMLTKIADTIAMGTREGVGLARGRNLRPCDRMRVEIEGLGVFDTLVEQVG